MAMKSLMLRFGTKALPDRSGQVEGYGREATYYFESIMDGCRIVPIVIIEEGRGTPEQHRAAAELQLIHNNLASPYVLGALRRPTGNTNLQRLHSVVDAIEEGLRRAQGVPRLMEICGDRPYALEVQDRIEYLQGMILTIQGIIELEGIRNDQINGFISHLTAQRNRGEVDHADLLIMADWLDEQEAVELARQLRDPNLNVTAAVRRILGERS